MLSNLARSVSYFAATIALPWLIGIAAAPAAQADEAYSPILIVPLPNGSQPLGSTDIAWVDHHTYGLADRSNQSVDIIDTRKNDQISLRTASPPFAGPGPAALGKSGGPNGVIIIERKGEIWAADGPVCPSSATTLAACTNSGSFKVIDLKSGNTKKVIYIPYDSATFPPPTNPVHGRIDELCYNPASDVVLGASNALGDSFISFVNEDSYAIVGTIRLDGTDPNATDPDDPLHTKITAVGGAIEQCQYNQRDGKFYLSIPSIDSANGAVLRISATAPFKVEKVFKINAAATGCNGPAGLTIGPDHQMLVGCNQKSTTGSSVIIDDRTGAVIQYVQTTWGVDEVWYDSGSNHYYLAQSCTPTSKPLVTCAGVTVMNVEDAGHGKTVPSPDNPPAATAPQSKNPAADPERNYVYLPVLGGKGTICSTTPDVNGNKSGSDSQGCIAIYSAPLDGDDRGGGDDDQGRARK